MQFRGGKNENLWKSNQSEVLRFGTPHEYLILFVTPLCRPPRLEATAQALYTLNPGGRFDGSPLMTSKGSDRDVRVSIEFYITWGNYIDNI